MVDGPDRVMESLAMWDPADPAPVPRGDVGMIDLVVAARRHRLIGVLASAAVAGAIETGEDDLAVVSTELTAAMSEVLLLEDVMLEAVDVLDGAGIDYRLLKGAALAHTVHSDPSLRSFGDTDLLVRSAEIDAAIGKLSDAGARRLLPALSDDFDRRFAKSVTLGWRRGTELDLHRTLASGPFGVRILVDDLWDDPSRFELAGVSIKTFSPELHLLHAAYHSALGDTEIRLGSARDLGLLMSTAVDTGKVVELATRWRGQTVLAEAVRMVTRLGGTGGELGRWAEHVGASRRDRRWLATYRHPRRFRRQTWPVTRELPRSDRLAYLRAVVFPARENLAARGGRRCR
jgi:hypothetical protein